MVLSPRRRLAVVVVAAVLVAGCSGGTIAGSALRVPAPPTEQVRPAPTPPAVTDRVVTRIVSLKTADGVRTAIVHHPAAAPADAPLLVVLHPAATSSAQMEANFGWDAIADRDHLVVAYPDGLLDGYQDTWNGGRCCAPANELGTDDVGFLSSLVSGLRGTDGVGATVYAVGYSNGGILGYAWACSRPGELAGLGVVAGALMTTCPATHPLTVVAVHGTADSSIPIGGGTGPGGLAVPALTDSLAPFRSMGRCSADPVVDRVAAATVSVWNCADGHRVVSDVIAGLGHSWPGAGPAAGRSSGPLDATGFLWARLSG